MGNTGGDHLQNVGGPRYDGVPGFSFLLCTCFPASSTRNGVQFLVGSSTTCHQEEVNGSGPIMLK